MLSYIPLIHLSYLEWMYMQSSVSAQTETLANHILVRHPAFPRRWNSVNKPHVAILARDPVNSGFIRYYLSRNCFDSTSGEPVLEVADIDTFEEGTLLEVRFDARTANLYRLELIDGAPCWWWIGRCRGLPDFEYPRNIDWLDKLPRDEISEPQVAGL